MIWNSEISKGILWSAEIRAEIKELLWISFDQIWFVKIRGRGRFGWPTCRFQVLLLVVKQQTTWQVSAHLFCQTWPMSTTLSKYDKLLQIWECTKLEHYKVRITMWNTHIGKGLWLQINYNVINTTDMSVQRRFANVCTSSLTSGKQVILR